MRQSHIQAQMKARVNWTNKNMTDNLFLITQTFPPIFLIDSMIHWNCVELTALDSGSVAFNVAVLQKLLYKPPWHSGKATCLVNQES